MTSNEADELFGALVAEYYKKAIEISARYKRLKEQAQRVIDRQDNQAESTESLLKFLKLIELGLMDYAEQDESYEVGLILLLKTWDNNMGNKAEMRQASNRFMMEELMKQRQIADDAQMRIVKTISVLRQMIITGTNRES